MRRASCGLSTESALVASGLVLLGAAAVGQVGSNTPALLVSEYELHEPTGGPKPQAFGSQVALSADGRTLAVADQWYFGGGEWPWYASGAVYVYVESGNGWILEAKLEPPDAQGYDFFGADIALSATGDTLAIGAEFEGDRVDIGTGDGFGAVFVFTRSDGVWSQQAYLQSPDPQRQASFGRTVELSASGVTLAVGAPFESIEVDGATHSSAGSAYVYERTADGWDVSATLRAPQPQSEDRFGTALRLSAAGDTVAVLAGEQNEATEDQDVGGWGDRNNTLYVFERSGSEWSLEATLEGSPDEPFFAGSGYESEGQREAFAFNENGDMLAVASPSGIGQDGETGYISFYERGTSGWVRSQTTLVPLLTERIHFGLRVTLSPDGTTLAAAANRDDGPYGRPYVVLFENSNGNWSQVAALESTAWPDYTSFGNSFSLSGTGNRLAIGSRSYSTDTTYWGAAFVY